MEFFQSLRFSDVILFLLLVSYVIKVYTRPVRIFWRRQIETRLEESPNLAVPVDTNQKHSCCRVCRRTTAYEGSGVKVKAIVPRLATPDVRRGIPSRMSFQSRSLDSTVSVSSNWSFRENSDSEEYSSHARPKVCEVISSSSSWSSQENSVSGEYSPARHYSHARPKGHEVITRRSSINTYTSSSDAHESSSSSSSSAFSSRRPLNFGVGRTFTSKLGRPDGDNRNKKDGTLKRLKDRVAIIFHTNHHHHHHKKGTDLSKREIEARREKKALGGVKKVQGLVTTFLSHIGHSKKSKPRGKVISTSKGDKKGGLKSRMVNLSRKAAHATLKKKLHTKALCKR